MNRIMIIYLRNGSKSVQPCDVSPVEVGKVASKADVIRVEVWQGETFLYAIEGGQKA